MVYGDGQISPPARAMDDTLRHNKLQLRRGLVDMRVSD